MQVTFFGTRGSIPVSSPDTARFGGNTTCILIRTNASDCIIIDAGTGIRALGQQMLEQGVTRFHILFTHAHWDHLQGLPFFPPMFDEACYVTFHGAANMGTSGVRKAIEQMFNGRNFPLNLDALPCRHDIREFTPGDAFTIGSAHITTCPTEHQGSCVAFKVEADEWSFLYTGDHEWGDLPLLEPGPTNMPLEALMKNVDVMVADGQYTQNEYAHFKGWGHSYMEQWPEIAARNSVRHLIITHHDPSRLDDDLSALHATLQRHYAHLPLRIDLAMDGMVVSSALQEVETTPLPYESLSSWLCNFSQELSRYTEVSMILDSVLTEARRTTSADAGTIYLVEGEHLVFSYTQNATLFSAEEAMRKIYLDARIPLDSSSIAGYAALTRMPLKIANVHAIPQDAPYRFNDEMDKASGYRTESVLCVPLLQKDKVLGVIQLINRKNSANQVVRFSADGETRLSCLAGIAVNAIERGLMTNELILRMLTMTAMRDPGETGAHVRRVGAIAAEVYQQWAMNKQIDPAEMRIMKSNIRLAAMLHDIGKVGIPDAVLKKPGPLTAAERVIIEGHCSLGRKIFPNADWGVDMMAQEIVLHHHQRWDGQGYTGDPNTPALAGEDIPWAARITSVADVFDALVSPRCYRATPFTWEKAAEMVRQNAGVYFDPDMAEAFEQILPVIATIYRRFPD